MSPLVRPSLHPRLGVGGEQDVVMPGSLKQAWHLSCERVVQSLQVEVVLLATRGNQVIVHMLGLADSLLQHQLPLSGTGRVDLLGVAGVLGHHHALLVVDVNCHSVSDCLLPRRGRGSLSLHSVLVVDHLSNRPFSLSLGFRLWNRRCGGEHASKDHVPCGAFACLSVSIASPVHLSRGRLDLGRRIPFALPAGSGQIGYIVNMAIHVVSLKLVKPLYVGLLIMGVVLQE